MQVLDLSKVGKLVLHVLLGRFLVNAGDDDDVSFDGCMRYGGQRLKHKQFWDPLAPDRQSCT